MRRLLLVALVAVAGCNVAPEAEKPVAAPAARPEKPDEDKPDDQTTDPKPAPRRPASGNRVAGMIRLPADGGAWPTAFAPAPPAVASKAVPLALEYGFHPMAVSPETGRFVITQVLGRRVDKAHHNGTRFIIGDVVAGKVIAQWEVGGEYEAVDLSPDGTRILCKQPTWTTNRLTLFAPAANGQLVGQQIEPHDQVTVGKADATREQLGVRWAGFVGSARFASAAVGGQVRVFDAATLDRVASVDGTPWVSPCVTPDRKKLIVHAAGRAVVIDPAAGDAVAAKPWPLPAGPTNLAASPDGTTLAAAKEGRVRFLAVKSGQHWDRIIPAFGYGDMPPKHFSWCGPAFLVHNRKVYDPGASFMVWLLGNQSHADAYTSRQVWAAARMPGDEAKSGPPIRVAVRAFDALPSDLPEIVAAAKARPNVYVFPPGGSMRVDVSKLPAAKQVAAKADIEQRLREVGFVPDPNADALFTASLDPPATKTTGYKNLENVTYTHQPIRLQLVVNGKVIYTRPEAKNPPGFAPKLAAGETLAQKAAADGWGQPDYAALTAFNIFPHFPGPGFPRDGLGGSGLAPEGTVYWGRR